jgi:transcriptional regulator with XRE-family HTH domain
MASRARVMRKPIHSSEQTAFCALMIGVRKKAGLTQQVVGKRLGKPQSFVAKYENGERRLDVIEFVAVARAIGADPVRLLKRFIAQQA